MKYHSYESIEKSAELLDSILEGSTEYGIIATDLDDKIIVFNSGAERIFGYTAEDMIGKESPIDFKEKDFIKNNILFMKRNIYDANSTDYQTNIKTKYGTSIPISVTVTKRKNIDEFDLGYLIIIRDITLTKLQEKFRDVIIEIEHLVNLYSNEKQMLDEILKLIHNFLDINVAYICLKNRTDQNFTICSSIGLNKDYKTHKCILRKNQESIDSQNCLETYSEYIISSDNLSTHIINKYIDENISFNTDMSIIHIPLLSDVSILGIFHVVVPTKLKSLYLEQTQILSLIANEILAGIKRKRLEQEIQLYANNLEVMVKDRTDELRKKDSQLIQSGKLATLGEMATGIAHEINQPLGSISLMTQGLLKAHKLGKLTTKILEQKLQSVLDQIYRIEKIINHLRVFGRHSPESMTEIDVNKPLMDVFELVGQQLKNRNIILDIELDNHLPTIIADHNKLEQVFLNIVSNARDALDDYEQQVKDLQTTDNSELIHTWKKTIEIKTFSKDNYVFVQIKDNAGGIPNKIKDKIFEPFFTTKEVGKGTGLGLSISYGIIKEFSGNIYFESEINKGTTFWLKFPKNKDELIDTNI